MKYFIQIIPASYMEELLKLEVGDNVVDSNGETLVIIKWTYRNVYQTIDNLGQISQYTVWGVVGK